MDTQTKIYFEKLLTTVVENKALGLHLSAGNPPVLKIEGGLKAVNGEAVLTNEKIKEFVLSFLDEKARGELEKNKEIIVVHSFKPQLRFKVNIFQQKNNLSASFRFIPTTIKTLGELGLEQVKKILAQIAGGVVIISGPFGSGKSTVVAGIIEAINNTNSKHIITLEKPIEFIFTNKKSIIEQREVGRDVKGFREGLKFLAEETVDIVALSEIEEPEIIRKAMELAQSGRMVIFQINADSSIKTLEKAVELFGKEDEQGIRSLLSENLAAVINLHLLKKVGGGNILVPEILVGNPAVRSIVREGKFIQLQNILQTGGAEGMVPLAKSVGDLVKNNAVSAEEARKQIGSGLS